MAIGKRYPVLFHQLKTEELKKKLYRNIPTYIRQPVIEQVVQSGSITASEAARRYGLHTSSVRNILDAWYTEGRVEKKPRGGRKETLKFEDKHGEFIKEFLDDNYTQTLDILKEALEHKFPDLAHKGISTSGLWRYLVNGIGFTLKRTKAVEERRNTKETIQQGYDYVVHRFPERGTGISYKTNCIFVDESGFNANLVRRQGYSKKGSTSVVVNATKRAVNISILAGISYHGVEDVSVKVVKGGTTGEVPVFKDFVSGIMKKLDDTNAGPHVFCDR